MPTRSDITAGISCKGNIQALLLCLSSICNATFRPARIQVRLEGELSGIANFYLEQLSDLARLRGIEMSFALCRSTGARDSRDWQLQHCATKWLWMLDDDVIADADCLEAYLSVSPGTASSDFLAGSKCDVNNRRNYPFFDMCPQRPLPLREDANHSLVYDVDFCWAICAPTKALDTGNCLLNVTSIRNARVTFRQFPDQLNCSGDGTTFWLALEHAGLVGYFVPSAVAYHLEKPGGGFNEFNARGEMLLRLCDVKGWNKESLRKYWMPSVLGKS
jgi:hypothetical protein